MSCTTPTNAAGFPPATVELKTDFTQSVADAVDQYRFDRQPRPKGQPAAGPLLSFSRGALVHFAVSSKEVQMTTWLDGAATVFLPFNQGDGGAAGDPVNPQGGHRTAYLWETVWAHESWLEILGRYLVAQRDKKKQLVGMVFPRFHQFDVTRKFQVAVTTQGAGGKYLVQHSAGSGKTNSIAWTAHFLADLHDAADKKVFDSVLVVSDRNVIDSQLQAIFGFERTTGVVATIKGEGGSKSAQLASALSGTKKIVVCTIQTFPFALEEVRRLAATQGKRFAVIADEAHSSQTGATAAQLKAVLSPEEITQLAEGGEVSTEDLLAAQMAARASESGITYVAFTATPKAKILELFGTRPDPSQPASPTNLPAPFHVYSMRQAIEEGFILDVLQNYTNYRLAFRLAHNGADYDEKQVERSTAMRGIMGWVRLHPYNIAQKVEIVVEHFREKVAPLLGGQAKAMVVTGSRVEAVRWQLAEIIEKVNTLFEGDLTDQDKLVYVNNVLMGKLLESEILRQQAAGNTKEQFANSPDLKKELVSAIISALDAHTAMSTQALGSKSVQSGLKDILLNQAQLYEALCANASDESSSFVSDTERSDPLRWHGTLFQPSSLGRH